MRGSRRGDRRSARHGSFAGRTACGRDRRRKKYRIPRFPAHADQVHIKDTRFQAPSVSLVYLVPICSIIRPSCSDLLTPPLVRSLPSGSDRTSIILILCQHGPNGSGHLVCQRNRNDEARLSSQHRLQPRLKRTRPTYCPPDYCHRFRNQQPSYIPLAHLGCFPEPLPPSG